MSLRKLQKGAFSMVVGVITGRCIIGTHAKRIDPGHLANDLLNLSADFRQKLLRNKFAMKNFSKTCRLELTLNCRSYHLCTELTHTTQVVVILTEGLY